MKTLQEINDELEKIGEEYSKLFDQEQKLKEEKNKLLAKEIFDSKSFNRYKWEVKKRDSSGFILKPIFDNDLKFDDIQAKLGLYPHGDFQLNDKIEICGDDGDLYIISSDIKAGIEFIKSQDIGIVICKSIINDIISMEKQVVELKEFINQFDMTKCHSVLGKEPDSEFGILLNLGCGKDKKPGYRNIDIREYIGADMILDLEKVPYPGFEDESVDKILASDIIEHFSFERVNDIVKEWHRILKVGGILEVRTPDFDEIVRWKEEVLDKEGKGWKDLSYHIYGAQDYIENYHKLIFTKKELRSFLESIGFKVENISNKGLNMICESIKLTKKEYIDE